MRFLTRARLALLALLFVVSAAAARAQENAIYVVHNNTQLSIVTDQTTGATAPVAGGTLLFGTSAAARDPQTGYIYYLRTNSGASNGQLAYWNPQTQSNTLVSSASSPGGVNVMRLAFNSAGVLYGSGTDGVLYTINKFNGAYGQIGTAPIRVTNKGNVTLPTNGDIAFGPNDTMYAAANCTTRTSAGEVCLYSINPTGNPTATEIGQFGTVGSNFIASLAFGIGGKLYAGADNGNYYTLNIANPAASTVTNTGTAYWDFAYTPKFADLSTTKTATPDPVLAGSSLTYTITVTNNGPQAATNVRITDPLPAGTLYRSHAAPAGWSCTTPAVGATGTVTCANPATNALANGASATITIAVTGPTAAGTISNTATASSDTIDHVAANSATRAVTVQTGTISGTVFEDVNYGGGAGRSLTASGGSPRPAARVELYDSSGAFVAFTTTAADGRYSFAGLAAGDYTVRVVNSSVTSSRTGYTAALLPVQTFRTIAPAGTAQADAARVGGQNPQATDAANGASGATINTASGVFTAGTGLTGSTAQSIANVTLNSFALAGIDFGFNFDTIVNTNDAGQGSLRQFITNANALANSVLSQALPAGVEGGAGVETSIFMIPSARLTNGVAVITLASLLPAITDTYTSIHGGTQTANTGDTNSGALGAGGSVGVDNLALPTVARPEVQITDGATNLAVGLDLQASNASVRGIAIYGFGASANSDDSANIRIGANAANAVIERNIVGATALSFTDPGAGARSVGDNVRSAGGDNGILRNNLVGFSAGKGFGVEGGSTGWLIVGNEIRSNGIGNSHLDGIDFETAGSINNTARGNLITGNEGAGIDTHQSGGGNSITNNTITGNGIGANSNVETPGIRLYGANNTVERNVITANFGAGVMVTSAAQTNLITRNSIAANGTIANKAGAAASGQIGIDLLADSNAAATGTAPYVTLNDNADADAGANGLLNFPVIESAQVIGARLILTGWARPGSIVEFFVAAPDPSGFGEGQTYITTLTEGASEDTDATVSAYSGAIAGRNVGADTTNRFRFSIPTPAGALGSAITATATVAGATSEFGNVVAVTNAPPGITLCKTLAGQTCVGQDVTFPAQVPGSEIAYVINFANEGGQAATGFVILDPVPANTDLKVGTPAAMPGTTGLTAAIEYSSDGGATWTYVPTSGAGGAPAGYDRTATHVRWRFAGSLSPAAPNNAGSVAFTVRIR